MKRLEQLRDRTAISLPTVLLTKLDVLNESVEAQGLKIGRSFIVRFALEELFKRPDARAALLDRKIDSMRAKVLA